MSIISDIFVWLLIDTALGFIFYSTGCFVLKVLTLGKFEIEFKDFSSFKAHKNKKVNLIILLGLCVYISLIVLATYMNS